MRAVIFVWIFAMCSCFGQQRGGSYIGVMMQEVEGGRGGVEITVVEKDGPAEKAGLKVGDVVLKYNGQRVEGMEQFAHMVRETPAGRDVKIDIARGGTMQTIAVHLALRKSAAPMERMDIHLPDLPHTFVILRSSALGVEAEALEGQLAQFFGVKDGVLVRSVLRGSAAERAGIKAGDVILKIEDGRVASPAEISARLRVLRSRSTQVVLMRDHKELIVTVMLGEEDPATGIQITPFQIHPNQP